MKHATMTTFAGFKSVNRLKPCCKLKSACLFISKLQVLKKDLEDIQGRYHNPGLAMRTAKAIRELRDIIICADKKSICTTAGNRKKDVALQDDFETAMGKHMHACARRHTCLCRFVVQRACARVRTRMYTHPPECTRPRLHARTPARPHARTHARTSADGIITDEALEWGGGAAC